MPLKLPCHAQVDPPGAEVWLQFCHQIFPAPSPLTDDSAREACTKTFRTTRTGNGTGSTNVDSCDFKTLKTVRQSPANRLNFRKFRQRPQAGSSSDSAKLLVLMPPSTPCMPL